LKKKFFNEEERIANKKAYMLQYRKDNKEKLAADDKGRTQERRVKNKLKAIEYLGGKCAHCGIVSKHRSIYDFHHLDKTEKEADPGSLMHYSWTRIQKELDKCILLCANCHRIEHEKDHNV
jgi:predicted HNH restriction endonuclease